MPILRKSALVNFNADQMYQLVNQVNRYHEFLPWCSEGVIETANENEMTAKVHMKKGPLDQSFTTHNKMLDGEMIEIQLIDGPFKKLNGIWKFENIDELGSKISLELEYEFSNAVISMVVGPVFNTIANTLVDSFVKRADQLYG